MLKNSQSLKTELTVTLWSSTRPYFRDSKPLVGLDVSRLVE